jgi:hypothetical protein
MPPLNRCTQPEPLDNSSRHSAEAPSSLSYPHDDDVTTNKLSDLHGRKSVAFHETINHVELIDHHRDWSVTERSYRWHSQQDYTKFRQDILSTIYVVRNHPEQIDGEEYTIRGIEGRDQANVERRQQLKQRARSVVFEEQQFQRMNTNRILSTSSSSLSLIEGNDWMASQYRQAAKPALQEALDLAVLDQIAALNYQMEGRVIHTIDEEDDNIKDEFNDDWIRSISSSSPTSVTSFSSSATILSMRTSNEAFGFSASGEASGFDDSWITQDM